jgi:MFS family permease
LKTNIEMNSNQTKNLRFNFTVNVLDGGFFGAALGFASFITVIPLFVSKLTDSAVLIGLIPAIHAVGWQLPQLFTAPRASKLSKYKRMALLMSLNERVPFLGLAVLAWFSPQIGVKWSLILVFALLIWQGFGGGLTATFWQSLIAKIMPVKLYGRFFGIQTSAVTFLMAIGSIIAGVVLSVYYYPLDFTLCFLLASVMMVLSFVFLALTKEESVSPVSDSAEDESSFREKLRSILSTDKDFRWYLIARMLTQFATMGFAFYTIYAVNEFGVDERLIGILTGLLLFTEVAVNPIMGWLGDRRGHLLTLQIGIVATIASFILAMGVRGVVWFFPIFILAGVANVAAWTVPLSMTLEFGTESQRPAYIGLANTLIAPSTFFAPVLAGLLIDNFNYNAAFLASAIAGFVTLIVLVLGVKDPRKRLASHQLVSPTD